MRPTDHSKTFATLRKIEKATQACAFAEQLARPVTAAGKLIGLTRIEQIAEGVCQIGDFSRSALSMARYLIDAQANHQSEFVQGLWKNSPIVAMHRWHDAEYKWRDVFGVPVVCDDFAESYWFASPESAAQIMERLRALGRSWVVQGSGAIAVDERTVPEIRGARTQVLIDRLQAFACPRAQLLWGPPGGGKTVAARQVLAACSRMSVTLSPRAAASTAIWDQVDLLQPDGLLIDDIDSVADLDSLLDRLERARTYANVILSTANTVTELRGALLRPGRASDDEPMKFDTLDTATVRAIASHVPGDLPPDLLAAYLAELEARALAGVLRADGSDVDELRRRMSSAGDR